MNEAKLHEFLGKLRPEFRFDRNVTIRDYPADMEVWGYGAQQPTAKDVVDAGLQVLREKRNHPLLLWLFNFDQHNWRELDALAVGVGFGLRIKTPLAPLRLDLGFPIPRRPGDPLLRWHFSIGQMF